MGNRYWSYDGENMQTHSTAEEARAACEAALEACREEAGSDGWPEHVGSIMWGPIAEWVAETERHEGHREGCADGECDYDCPVRRGFDYWAEYALEPIDPEVTRGPTALVHVSISTAEMQGMIDKAVAESVRVAEGEVARAREKGRAEERAVIVAWLLDEGHAFASEDIERGKHREEDDNA